MELDPSHVPAQMPPPGAVPNFDDPTSLAPVCLVLIAATLPLMVIFLGLRIYVRLWVSRSVGADDVLCLISACLVVAFCGIALSFLNNPVGPHQWDVPVSKVTDLFQKLSQVSVVLFALASMAVKSTLLVFYLRIFSSDPRAKTLIWGRLAFVVVFYTISVIVNLAACVPRADEDGWSVLVVSRNERCLKQGSMFAEVQGVIGVMTDLYVWFIPMPLLAKIRLSRKRKFGVYGIFAIGFMACIVSIASAAYRFVMFQYGDILWVYSPIYGLGAAELNIGIVCACMPVIFGWFKTAVSWTNSWITKLRSSTDGRENSEQQDRARVEVERGPHRRLPSIPKGTLTGLMSYMSRSRRTRAKDTELGTIRTADELNYEYHAYMSPPERGNKPGRTRDMMERPPQTSKG